MNLQSSKQIHFVVDQQMSDILQHLDAAGIFPTSREAKE
jgi:hypothetical protein